MHSGAWVPSKHRERLKGLYSTSFLCSVWFERVKKVLSPTAHSFEAHPQTIAVEVVPIPTPNRIFGILRVLKLHMSRQRGAEHNRHGCPATVAATATERISATVAANVPVAATSAAAVTPALPIAVAVLITVGLAATVTIAATVVASVIVKQSPHSSSSQTRLVRAALELMAGPGIPPRRRNQEGEEESSGRCRRCAHTAHTYKQSGRPHTKKRA